MERPIIPLTYPTPIERFEALYTKIRNNRNDGSMRSDYATLYSLCSEVLEGLNISIEDFIKAEWNQLHSGSEINPCNVPFSNLFLLREYNDRLFRFNFLDGLAQREFHNVYVGDELVALADKMVNGDDDLDVSLLFTVFDHIIAIELKPDDVEKMFTVIEKALDVFDEEYSNKDVLSRISTPLNMYQSKRVEQIIQKASKHASEEVRSWFKPR